MRIRSSKKADMGIGTLILFIAMILVAAIAAGVLLQTAGSLQSKALLTGERTKTEVSTAAQVILLYAEDGSRGNLTYFCQKMSLAPGSDPIAFQDTLIEFDTRDSSSDKIYGFTPNYVDNMTWLLINTDVIDDDGAADLNDDGAPDFVTVSSNTQISVFISDPIFGFVQDTVTIPDISLANETPVTFSTFDEVINVSTTVYGSITVVGTTRHSNNITDDAHIFISTATGGYGVKYLIRGPSYKVGFLQRGDVVRVCYGSPRIITTDEDISIRFIPKVGHVTLIETATPDILNDKREYIYP